MNKLLSKFTFYAILVSLSSLLLLTSCEKDPQDLLGSISVQLKLKEGMSGIALNNISLNLLNTQDNVERTVLTDASGFGVFTSLPAGAYNLTVSEPRENGEYTLIGTLNSIVVTMKNDTPVELEVDAAVSNTGLVIKELYYPGAADAYASLFKDQFIEIFNNSNETIYADGLYVGHIISNRSDFPHPTSQMPGLNLSSNVYLEWAYQIPGNGTQYPIEPSKSFMIALNAMNFKEGSSLPDKSVDNTIADFETYAVDWLEAQGITGHIWDFDNPDVPNVTPIYLHQINLFLFDLSEPGAVIFRKEGEFTQNDIFTYTYTNTSGTESEIYLLTIPADIVIDGIECLENSTRGLWKRLPASIDASFTYLRADGGSYYSSESSRRKIDAPASAKFGRTILQDLNNSQLDFEMITPPDAKGYN